MEINTLIIGYIPLTETTGKKFREIRDDKYFKELFASFDLGTLHYVDRQNWKAKIDELNPIIIVYIGGEYYADEVKKYKGDAMLYAADDGGSIFYRKAQIEEKKEEHKKIFSEIEKSVKKIRENGEEEIANIRKFSAMSYDDLYKMITRAIISDNKEAKEKAWELLFGEGERHQNLIWMRLQLMCEVWEHADWKTREKLMCMSMERHIDQGTARKMDNFIDENGLEYYQYMFLDPMGNDTNHVRRLPFATEGQDRYAYENLLEKNEIPTNYLRVQVESNSLRKQYDDYLACECTKVKRVLEEWEKDNNKSKKELGVIPWEKDDDTIKPLNEEELNSLKNFLKKYSTK